MWQQLADNPFRRFALLFVATFSAALLVAWPTLSYPWYWDDYHLIRVFSPAELLRVFRGPWDVDGIESASYRPLWVVANHARAWLFGEHVLLHRLLLLAVLALFTTLLTIAVQPLGLALHFGAGAAVVSVWAKSNHANLMWLTDATHALSGIPPALACFVPLRSTGRSRFFWPLLTLALALIGLLVREDIAALFPLVVIVQVARARCGRGQRASAARELSDWLAQAARASAPLASSLVFYFALRRAFVTNAVTGFQLSGLWAHVKMTSLIMGSRLPSSVVLLFLLFAALLLLAALFAPARLGGMRWSVVTFLGCALLGCTPGLVLERSNLLMVPNLLLCFALASAVQAVHRSGLPTPLWVVTIALCATFSAVTFRQTRRALWSGHPESTETVRYAGDFLYGQYASRATIPPERRAAGHAYLRRFGIVDATSYSRALPALIEEARARPKCPDPAGRAFNPPSPFLVH